MCVLFLSIVIIVIGLFWVINMHKAIETSGGLACSVVTIFHDIQHGYKDDKITFAGIGGVQYFVSNLKDETKKMQNVPELGNMINRNFPAAKKDLQDKIKAFYDNFKSKKVSTCEVGTGLPDVTPGVISGLTPQINEAVNKEVQALIKVGDSIDETARSIKQVADGQGKKIIEVFDNILDKLKEASDKVEEVKKEVLDKVDFTKSAKYLKMFLWYFSLGIFGLILFNLLIMCTTMKLKKCLWLNCFSKLIMSSQCCLGGLISGTSLTMMLIAVFLVNGCFYYDKAMVDKNYLKDVLNEKVHKISLKCLYKDSTGDLTELIGAPGSPNNIMKNLEKFKDIGKFTDEIKVYKDTQASIAMTKYRDEFLKKTLAYEITDILPGKANFDTNLKNLNTKAHTIKAEDEYVLNEKKCPEAYQKSKPGDAVGTAKGSQYCIIIPQFKHDAIDPRYAPKTEANAPYAAMKKCTKSHDQLVTSMTSSLDSGPIQSSKGYLKKVRDSLTDAESVVTKMQKTAKFLGSMKGGVKEILDCRVLQKEMNLLRRSICDKDQGFGMRFALQAWLLTILGPLMSVLGCCLCCQTRLAERDKDKKSYSQKKKDLKKGLNDGIEVTELHL